jgi:PAS domain S-box-containing protein
MDLYFSLLFIIVGSCAVCWLLLRNRRLSEENHILEKAFNQVTPLCVTNKNYEIVTANDAYWSIFGKPKDQKQPVKCFEHRPGKACHTENCPLTQILKGRQEFICEPQKEYEGDINYYIVTAKPYYGRNNEILGVIESFQDITARKKLENEKGQLITELQESLGKVKLLSGFLPICASCKKIRDDKGYWNQIEGYIRDHSEAEFSHGICPDCAQKLYPDLDLVKE